MKKIVLLIISLLILSITYSQQRDVQLRSNSRNSPPPKNEGDTVWFDVKLDTGLVSGDAYIDIDYEVSNYVNGVPVALIQPNSEIELNISPSPVRISGTDTIVRVKFFIKNDGIAESNDTFEFKLTNVRCLTSNNYKLGFYQQVKFIVNPSTGTGGSSTVRPLYSVATVRGANKKYIPDSMNVNCRLRGVLYGKDLLNTGYQYSLCDGTGCISIYSTKNYANITSLKEGDSVEVSGKITHFSGLGEINFGNTGDTILKLGTKTLKAAVAVQTLNESTESKLIKLDTLTLETGTWQSNADFDLVMKKPNGDLFTVRINNTGDSISASDAIVSGKKYVITGLGSQYDTTSDRKGYNIVPRYKSDIDTVKSTTGGGGGVGIAVVNLSSTFSIFPNPAQKYIDIQVIGGTARDIIAISIRDIQGREVLSNIAKINSSNSLRVDGLDKFEAGTYFIEVRLGEQTHTKTFTITK